MLGDLLTELIQEEHYSYLRDIILGLRSRIEVSVVKVEKQLLTGRCANEHAIRNA